MVARLVLLLMLGALIVSPLGAAATTVTLEQDRVRLWIPAVGQREDGTLFGVASDLEVVMQRPGSGRVYVSTQPLTQVDMQGSARLAVDAASSITGVETDSVDFFFSVKTPAVTIGGPSAGGAMAVAVTALLKGWTVRDDVVMTGMINPDGSIGPIGGVLQKLQAADSVGANTFLVPLGQSVVLDAQGQEVDAKAVGRDEYGIEVEEVADLYDAVAPFTGNRLVRPTPTTDPLKDAAYADITNRLSEELTSRAGARRSDLQQRVGATEIPSASDERVIRQQLATGDDQLRAAFESQNQSKHYSAASQAFQALVSYGYAEAILAYFEGDHESVAAYSGTYLETTDAFLATVEREVNVTYPIRAAQLDSFGASEDRLMEAQAMQAQARQERSQNDQGETLRLSSFARERAESARWWTAIGREVAKDASDVEISEAGLRALVEKYTDAATLALEYTALIASGQSNYPAAARAFQVSQDAREQGRLAASLNSLVESFARTSTALAQLSGADAVRSRLPTMSDAAAYEIEVARGQGVPPIFAVSVLELGQAQFDADPVTAYAFLLQARLAARTSILAANVTTPAAAVQPVRGPLGLPNEAPAWIGLGVVFALIAIVLVLVVLNAEARRTRMPSPAAAAEPPPSTPPMGSLPVDPPPAPSPAPPEPSPAPASPTAPPPEASPPAKPEAKARARTPSTRRPAPSRTHAPGRPRRPPAP